MKRHFILLLILLVFLYGCTKIQQNTFEKVENSDTINRSNETSFEKVIVNEQSLGQKGMFYLGMTYNELTLLDLYNTDYQISNMIVIEDNRNAWDYKHKVIWTPILCCVFDEAEILYRITVNGELPTTLGLKNGDSIAVLEKLYGKSNKKYDTEVGYILEYKLDDHYFYVNIDEESIKLWGVSKYRYDFDGILVES